MGRNAGTAVRVVSIIGRVLTTDHGTALTERAAVRRLLDRFGFGPRPGDVAAAVGRGFDATLDTLLDPPADAGAAATPEPDLGPEPPKADKTDTAAKQARARELRQQQVRLTVWWLDRMVAADAPLTERLTWFWHGHFATSDQKVRSPRLMQRQNDTLRKLGAGGFATLAKAVMVDPAMLVWLDGQRNKVGAAKENLSRESMELFMLGVGRYTETDVREAARALTGWAVDRAAGTSRQVPHRHDNGPKTVLGTTGDLDVNSFVDIVLAQPASPRYVVGRLWSRLVCATAPEPAVLDRLVEAYGPGRDIRATLRAIATDPAFTDSTQVLVKQPVEWAVGLMRALRVRPAHLPAHTATALLTGLRNMGQVPFLPPSVGGWPAGPAWLTTSAGLARLRLAHQVAAHADLSAVTGVDAVRDVLGVDEWTDRTRSALGAVAGSPKQLTAVAACAPEYVVSL
jgi:uncharacterized protein (DUF1800 family)